MNPKKDRTQSGQPRPAETPAPPRRFRIEKLEERIAPSYGCRHNAQTKYVGGRHTVCCT